MTNCNALTSRQGTCLLPHLILNSHLPLISWIHQDSSSETLNLPQKDIDGRKSVRSSIETVTFTDNIFQKKKIENLKTEINSSLESTISFLFQKKFKRLKETLKDKCEKLMRNSYSDYKGQINNLRKEIENKDEIIRKLSETLNDFNNNLPLKVPTVTLAGNELVLKTALSNYNENILSSTWDFPIVKDKDDCASILIRSTKINEQMSWLQSTKVSTMRFFQKTTESEFSDENYEIDYPSPKDIKHTWPAGTCVVWEMGYVTGINKKGLVRIDL